MVRKNWGKKMEKELLELIPLYKVEGEGLKDKKWTYLNLRIEFHRQQIKDINESIGNRFKQFGIGNCESTKLPEEFLDKKNGVEAPTQDGSWPAPFSLVQIFGTEISNNDRVTLKSCYNKIISK